MLKTLLKRVLPVRAADYLRGVRARRVQARVKALPPLTEDAFTEIVKEKLEIDDGSVVFVHSSMDRLNLAFPFFRVLSILRRCAGDEGILLLPTYPKLGSYDFLMSGETFDVRHSPSYTGILTEFARRQPDARRSLHPTKSVCALGTRAEEFTGEHAISPYPYGEHSPYHKMIAAKGKVVGIGVGTYSLSAVHCVDDALKDDFPVSPYHEQVFSAPCRDYDGSEVRVNTFAHDLGRLRFNIPRFMKRHVSPDICEDFVVDGMPFFRADAEPLFNRMVNLARNDVTIYARSMHREPSR